MRERRCSTDMLTALCLHTVRSQQAYFYSLFEHFVLKSAKQTPSLYELVLKNKFTYTQKRKLQALGIFTHDSVG